MDEIRRMFGDKFVVYVLACETSELDGGVWSQEQNLVVQALLQIASSFSGRHPYEQEINIVNLLVAPSQENGLSLTETWHLACGGEEVRRSVAGNPPLDALWKLAVLVYPSFLLSRPVEDGLRAHLSFSGAIFNHPAQL
jgi:hypothetical protein